MRAMIYNLANFNHAELVKKSILEKKYSYEYALQYVRVLYTVLKIMDVKQV